MIRWIEWVDRRYCLKSNGVSRETNWSFKSSSKETVRRTTILFSCKHNWLKATNCHAGIIFSSTGEKKNTGRFLAPSFMQNRFSVLMRITLCLFLYSCECGIAERIKVIHIIEQPLRYASRFDGRKNAHGDWRKQRENGWESTDKTVISLRWHGPCGHR